MEAVQKSNIKVPNSLLVTGLTDTETDEELYDFLKQYGSIQTVVPVDPIDSGAGKQAIIEYTYGTAVQSFSALLPYRFSPKDKPDTLYLVEALSNVYTPEVTKTATQTYLTELKGIAKRMGKSFFDVLKRELTSISEAADSDSNDQGDCGDSDLPQDPDSHNPSSPSPVQPFWGNPLLSQTTISAKTPTLKASDVNPPELQKVIVEHILRTEDLNTQINTPFRIKLFSGRCPCPNNEVDFESWRSRVELLLKDTNQPDSYKSRRLIESLSSPAVDLVKHLPAESPPTSYLKILDSAFGTVEDEDDLFAKYLNMLQNHGEEPSSYLQRLQVMLNTTLVRGGISAGELDKQLLKQFIRGCWDNDLIAELQLEQKKQDPPTFAELLLLLRTAERRRTTKMSRMKHHLNISKPKVFACYQGAQSQSPERVSSSAVDTFSEIQDLKKQIASLQSHLASLKHKKDSEKPKGKPQPSLSTKQKGYAESSKAQKPHPSDQRTDNHPSNRPRPWYCFRCGEDGHIKPQCENEPNSPLVALKRKQLKDKQIAWDKSNAPEYDSLN